MTTLSLQPPFSKHHISPLSLSTFHFLSPPPPTINLSKLGFCTFNSLRTSRFRTFFESPTSFSAADEDDDFDDDEAADEYEDVSGDGDVVVDEEVESEEEEEEEFNAAFWSSEETKLQRVKKLCDEVREFGDGFIDVNELASIYDFRIDKFQKQAMKAFLRGSSVVVSAPTSSGKTLIAEAAAVATMARGKQLLYTTPLKALSNQKFREFRDTFGDSNVGLLTGDSAINKDAQVLIMTTEILRSMLYQRSSIAQKKFNLIVCQQLLQIQMS